MTDSSAEATNTPWLPDDAKLASLAEFAAGAGHEINNPLSTILGRAQILLSKESEPEKRRSLEVIASQALRIRDMIGDLMLFARPPRLHLQKIDLVALVEKVCQQQRTEMELSGSFLDWQPPEETSQFTSLVLDSRQISLVLAELLRNARQATQVSGGEVIVSLECLEGESLPIRLTVADEGHGFSDLDRQHAFDPFYSGRQAGRGIGFGLCKAWQIVNMHQGQLEITSQPGGPTMLKVQLPSNLELPEPTRL